jgi:DNA-binding CsgD family transcriptional regulator
MQTQVMNVFDQVLRDILQKRELPGIFVIDPAGKVVFASEEGRRFLVESVSKVEQHGVHQNGQNGQNGQAGHDSGQKITLLPDSIRNFAREVCKPFSANGSNRKLPTKRAILFHSPMGHYYIVMAMPLARSGTSTRRGLVLMVVQRVGQRKNFNPERLGQVYGLTRREQEVVAQLVRGDSNKEIAASLHIQEYTVKDHLKHIMAKCQADSRVSVISKVLEL